MENLLSVKLKSLMCKGVQPKSGALQLHKDVMRLSVVLLWFFIRVKLKLIKSRNQFSNFNTRLKNFNRLQSYLYSIYIIKCILFNAIALIVIVFQPSHEEFHWSSLFRSRLHNTTVTCSWQHTVLLLKYSKNSDNYYIYLLWCHLSRILM